MSHHHLEITLAVLGLTTALAMSCSKSAAPTRLDATAAEDVSSGATGGATGVDGVDASAGTGGATTVPSSADGGPGTGGLMVVSGTGGAGRTPGTGGEQGSGGRRARTTATGGRRGSGGAGGSSVSEAGGSGSGGRSGRGGNQGRGGSQASGGAVGTGGVTVAGTGGTVASAGGTTGLPTLGAHNLVYTRGGQTRLDTVTTKPVDTQPSGSTILVAVARGAAEEFRRVPTDNQGNSPYVAVGTIHRYKLWPYSGNALYAFTSAAGGPGHTVTVTDAAYDEVTVFMVEVKNASRVQDAKVTEVLKGSPLTTPSVTTTGPATLISFCWGDAAGYPTNFKVGDGFEIIEDQPLSDNYVEGALAYKNVASAGTYSATWTANQSSSSSGSTMGAILYLIALEP